MGDPNWLGNGTTLLFTTPDTIADDVDKLLQSPSLHGGFGEGLSPFTTFKINLGLYRTSPPPPSIRPLLSSMSEMIVAIELEFGADANGTPYIGTCH
jgi:hypothetical protein